MSSTPAVPVAASRTPRPGYPGIARIALAAAILVGGAHAAGAQTPTVTAPTAPQPSPWEFRVSSGALVPTGVQRDVLKNAALTVAQLSYVVRPPLALTGSFGWARSRDVASAGAPKVDVFTYDLGAEARAPQWFADHALTLSTFAGGGVGGRSYNYRNLDVDATRNVAAYGAVGGEVGIRRRVHLRLEVRDYVGGFKPLAGGGHGDTRNDVVLMAGLRFSRR
jgi:hypothetical protein